MPASSTALLLGIIGVGSTAGRFFLGGLADRMGRQSALLLLFVGMAIALAMWTISTTFWPLAGFAFVYGMIYGAWVAVLPAVVMDYFGGRNVSGIIGILYTSVAFGTLIGPSAAGFAFDLTHDYTLPILAGAAANIVAAIIVVMTRTPGMAGTRPSPVVVIARSRHRANHSLTRLANVNSISARYRSHGPRVERTPFRKFISRQRSRSMASTGNSSFRIASAFRGGPIRWLILGGTLLIAAIAIGATIMAGNFRERALRNSERELENTVLLLARHFDQQLEDFQVVQKDLIAFMRSSGIATVENYKRRMSATTSI